MSSEHPHDERGDRLDSWKGIADYLGREVRSVQRWEKERGLPVQRIPGDRPGRVFAYTRELDAWLHSGSPDSGELGEDAATSERLTESRISGSDIAEASLVAQPEDRVKVKIFLAAGLAVAIALAAMGYWWVAHRQVFSSTTPRRDMLAVLPFQNLSGDPAQEYFADGFTEEMITDVGRWNPQRLGVIARTSAMKYKNSHEDIAQIGRELGVNYVLEGSVRRNGLATRISAQLIRVSDQTHVWAQNYERSTSDMLSVQREVADAIASKIQVQLATGPQAAPTGPANAEAYDAYLRGLYLWNRRDGTGINGAVGYFEKAIAADSHYAPAYAALAQSYTLLGISGTAPDDFARARAAAVKALELDDSSAEAHTALAGIKVFADHDWSGAAGEFERALQLNPNYAPAHHWYASLYLDPQGHYDKAIEQMQLAQRLDPTNFIVNSDLGQAYYFARQNEKAQAIYQGVVQMDANFQPAHWYLADVYRQMGNQAGEVEQMALMYELMAKEGGQAGRFASWPEALRQAYRRNGYRGYQMAHQRLMEQNRGSGRRTPAALVVTHLALGEPEQALDVLDQLYPSHDPHLLYLQADPVYDLLRTQLRFQALERKIGLLP